MNLNLTTTREVKEVVRTEEVPADGMAIEVVDNGAVLLFHPATVNGKDYPQDLCDTSVSLARMADHCFFSLDRLAEHDSHAPPMPGRGTAPETVPGDQERGKYLFRILRNIATQADAQGYQTKLLIVISK